MSLRIACPEGLGNRVAAIANALTWQCRIRFEWDQNEHCPLPWNEVFPAGISGVEFIPAQAAEVSALRGVPAMDWNACRCHHHAALTYRRVTSALCAKQPEGAPPVAILARFHRVSRYDLPRLVNAACATAVRMQTGRVFVLADQHRSDIQILARRLWDIDVIPATSPELSTDLDRSPETLRAFIQDWQTVLAARHIIALDGPTSLLHPARAAGVPITYA